MIDWRGEDHVEYLSKFFMDFMSETNKIALKEMKKKKIEDERKARKARELKFEEERMLRNELLA